LLIDNRRAAHSRSPFTARFDGTDRLLRRMMVAAGPVPQGGYGDQPELDLGRSWKKCGVELACIPYSLHQRTKGRHE
jgi:hypothetical protein